MNTKTIALGDLIAAQRGIMLACETFHFDVICFGVDEHGYLSVHEYRTVFERAGMVDQVWSIKEAADTINAALHAHPELSWTDAEGFTLNLDPGEGESWRLTQRPAPEEA